MISSKDNIQEEPTQILFKLIRMCHPQEHGEKWDRWEVMAELERRGMQVFDDIGWSRNLDHIYKNRYTACEETLREVLEGEDGYYTERGDPIEHQIFNVLECWMPAEKWDAAECFKEYLPKEHNPNNLCFWFSQSPPAGAVKNIQR